MKNHENLLRLMKTPQDRSKTLKIYWNPCKSMKMYEKHKKIYAFLNPAKWKKNPKKK